MEWCRPVKKMGELGWLFLALGCGGSKGDDTSMANGVASSTAALDSEVDSTATTDSTSTEAAATSTSASTSVPTSTSGSSSGDSPLPTPDSSFCPLDWSGPTTIMGTAPFGSFSGSVAWFEWQFCNGFYPLVLVVEDPAQVQDLLATDTPIQRAIAFSLPLPGWEDLAMVGDFTPEIYAMVDGQWTDVNLSQGAVTVSISVSVNETQFPVDVPRISGSFVLQGGQGAWDLSGSFDAAYCGPLNDFKAINCD